MKYRITNTTGQTDRGARNVYIIEAGKLLAPGASIPCNRLDPGTLKMGESGVLKIEEGDFPKPDLFPEKEKVDPAKIEPLPERKAKKAKKAPPPEKPLPPPEPAPKPAPVKEEPLPDKTTDTAGKTSSDG